MHVTGLFLIQNHLFGSCMNHLNVLNQWTSLEPVNAHFLDFWIIIFLVLKPHQTKYSSHHLSSLSSLWPSASWLAASIFLFMPTLSAWLAKPGISVSTSCFSVFRLHVGSATLFPFKMSSNAACKLGHGYNFSSHKALSLIVKNCILAAIWLTNPVLEYTSILR